MSKYSPQINLLFTIADVEFASHYVYPNTSHQRLILPKDAKFTQVALHFFSNKKQRLKMFFHNTLNGTSLYCTENNYILSLKTITQSPNAYSAVSLGTPGPYNKQSVLLIDKNLQPISLTKVGSNPQTSYLLQNEAHWLKSLNKNPALKGKIPLLIQTCDIDSLSLLTQSIHMGTVAKNILTTQHIDFLSTLQESEKITNRFNESVMHSSIAIRLQFLEGKFSKEWVQRASLALDKIIKTLEKTKIPMVLSHRDFAPWNIKSDINGIFVFDWEYTSQGYFPLYDIFHFIVMPLALQNKIRPKNIPDLLTKAENYGLSLNSGESKIRHSKIQLLGYLLDVCLFYLESNDGNSADDSIVNRYTLLIDEICK